MFTMKILIMMILISVLSGCATGSKDSILPQQGPTMKEVYDGHFTGEGHTQQQTTSDPQNRSHNNISPIKPYQSHEIDYSGYTRQAHNEIQNIFPRLKNKTLVMYVFPHLSKGERHPIPGYSTAFTFYKRTEFALPGEETEGY